MNGSHRRSVFDTALGQQGQLVVACLVEDYEMERVALDQ